MKSNQTFQQEIKGDFDLKSAPVLLKHQFKISTSLVPISIIAVSLFSSQIAEAESFGRVATTGTWTDGNWVGSSGGTAPANSDNVYIGDAGAVNGSVEPAMVNLGSAAAIHELTLGNSQSGTLDILKAGKLSAPNVTVKNGLLNVRSGGGLSSESLILKGEKATATLNRNAEIKINYLRADNGSTLTLKSDVDARATSVYGSILNLDAGTLSGNLYIKKGRLGNDSGRDAKLNQRGGHVDLSDLSITGSTGMIIDEGDSVSGKVYLRGGATLNSKVALGLEDVSVTSGSSFTSNSALNLAGLNTDNATVTFNGETNARFLKAENGSVLTVNTDVASINTDVIGSTLNLDAGTLSGRLNLDFENSGGVGGINQRGGHVDLTELVITGPIGMAIDKGDSVSNRLILRSGATLNSDKALDLDFSGLYGGATLNLSEKFKSKRLWMFGASTTINRTNGAALEVERLVMKENANYVFDGTDTLSNSVEIHTGSSFIAESALDQVSSLTASNATITLNAETNLSYLGAANDAKLTVNADVASDNINVSNSTLNLNAGTLSGNLDFHGFLGSSQVKHNGGHLDLTNLNVDGSVEMTLDAGDSVSNSVNLIRRGRLNALTNLEIDKVILSEDSTFTFTQESGETNGLSINNLSIDASSILDLQFDSTQETGLDWALRLTGNKASDLQAFLDNNLIKVSGGTAQVGIIYDATNYGDYTYLGYVSAVPLPGALPFMVFGISALGFFSRKKSVK